MSRSATELLFFPFSRGLVKGIFFRLFFNKLYKVLKLRKGAEDRTGTNNGNYCKETFFWYALAGE